MRSIATKNPSASANVSQRDSEPKAKNDNANEFSICPGFPRMVPSIYLFLATTEKTCQCFGPLAA
jgi:hypothetical protein